MALDWLIDQRPLNMNQIINMYFRLTSGVAEATSYFRELRSLAFYQDEQGWLYCCRVASWKASVVAPYQVRNDISGLTMASSRSPS